MVGQWYETLYAKIAREIPSVQDLEWGEQDKSFTQFLIQFLGQSETNMTAYIDWATLIEPGNIQPGVYPLTLPGGGEIETPLVVDFDL